MRVYRGGKFVEDHWRDVGDEGLAESADEAIIVPLGRWRAQPELRSRRGKVGVLVRAGDEPDIHADELAEVPLIVITFPKFTDGRGYSLARMFRERHGFKGEIRAIGEVLLDQIPLMLRCGFDAFAISHGPTIAALERGHLPGLELSYQRPAGGRRRYSTNHRRSGGEGLEARERTDGAGQA